MSPLQIVAEAVARGFARGLSSKPKRSHSKKAEPRRSESLRAKAPKRAAKAVASKLPVEPRERETVVSSLRASSELIGQTFDGNHAFGTEDADRSAWLDKQIRIGLADKGDE